MSAGIDAVLQAAVDAGDVPGVVAMAADASGPIYEGAAGPRAVGDERPGDAGHDVPDRVDDEDGHDRRGAAAGRARQSRPRRAGRPVPAGVRRPPGARGLRRRHAAAAPARDPGDRAPSRDPHQRARLLVLQRRHRALGGGHRDAERALRLRRDLRRPARRRPGRAVRVRHQHGLARPRGRGGERPVARRLLRRAHPRTAGDDHDDVPDERGAARATRCRCTCGARTARGRRVGRRLVPGARLVGRRPRAALDAARVPALPAHAARRRDARRRADPRSGDRRRGFTNQIGELDFPPAIATADPAVDGRLQRRPRLQVGPRPAAQHGAASPACARRAAARGRAS